MLPCSIVVIQIIEKVNLAVKVVEEAAGDSKAFVEEADGPDDWRSKDILEPRKARVGDGYTEENNQMLDTRVGRKLGTKTVEKHLIRVRVIDLMTSSLGTCIDSEEGDPSSKSHIHRSASLFDIRSRKISFNQARLILLILKDKHIFWLSWMGVYNMIVRYVDVISRW